MVKLFKIISIIIIVLTIIFILYSNNILKTINTQKTRLLCLVTTEPKNHKTKALAVRETWGQRCDVLLFVSSAPDLDLPIIETKCEAEDHSHLWCKNRKGIVEAHQRFADSYDWFLKADDDTYVIVENLKHLVSRYQPSDPIWFGCPFHHKNDVKFYSGGAGYVLSKEAVNRLIDSFSITNDKCNAKSEIGPDDLFLGICLEINGVEFGEERDELGRPRFFPFSPQAWLNPRESIYNSVDWFRQYSTHNYSMGKTCCSETSISFHYISPTDMYVYDFFLYNLKVYK